MEREHEGETVTVSRGSRGRGETGTAGRLLLGKARVSTEL